MNFEVILSEADFNKETIDYVEKHRDSFSFQIHHIFQKEDKGFRKDIMLNRALLLCNTDYIVFIDGDYIPHRHFVKEYIKNLR